MFIEHMETRYPEQLRGNTIDDIYLLYEKLDAAECFWRQEDHEKMTEKQENHIFNNDDLAKLNVRIRSTDVNIDPLAFRDNGGAGGGFYTAPVAHHTSQRNETLNGTRGGTLSMYHPHTSNKVLEHIAHGLHKASITILGVLFVGVSQCLLETKSCIWWHYAFKKKIK